MNKKCSKCGINDRAPVGSWCKPCRANLEANRRILQGITPKRKRNPEHSKNGLKQCFKCDKVLPFDDFSPCIRGTDGRNAWCKKCSSQYASDNRDLYNEYLRSRYRKTEKYKRYHRHESHLRRAINKESDVDDNFLKNLYSQIECFYCGLEVEKEERTADHVNPLDNNGTHQKSNIVMSCGKCNYIKGNRSVNYLLDKLTIERTEVVNNKIWHMMQE